MAVTIPSANGVVTITSGSGDVQSLAANIGSFLNALGPQAEFTLYQGTGPIPAADTASGATQVLDINDTLSGSLTQTVPAGYSYVIDQGTNEGDLTINNATLLTGTVGGTFNLTGNSTIAATGGNNTVDGTGSYLMSFGPGNNLVFAEGTGTVATDPLGTATITSGSVNGTGNNTILSAGSGDLVFAYGATSVDATGPSFQLLGEGGAINASISGNGATVSAGTSNASVTTAGSNAIVFGGAGAAGTLNVDNTGSTNTIAGFSAQATIASSGNDALIFGGSGTASVNVTAGTGDTLVGGSGAMTVDASSATNVFGGTGMISFVGGAGASTLLGGNNGSEAVTVGSGGIVLATYTNNTATVVGSPNAGVATIFGSDGSVVNFNETVSAPSLGGGIMVAGTGNETLNAAQSNANQTLAGGADSTGADSLVGGSGSNTFFAGAAVDTMAGGSNENTFAFFASNVTSGANYVITNFTSQDTLDLLGFDPSQSLSTILANASTGSNGLTITLSDSVSITFTNLTNTDLLAKQTFYG